MALTDTLAPVNCKLTIYLTIRYTVIGLPDKHYKHFLKYKNVRQICMSVVFMQRQSNENPEKSRDRAWKIHFSRPQREFY